MGSLWKELNMSHNHFVNICPNCRAIDQCRCMSKYKETSFNLCDKCKQTEKETKNGTP